MAVSAASGVGWRPGEITSSSPGMLKEDPSPSFSPFLSYNWETTFILPGSFCSLNAAL